MAEVHIFSGLGSSIFRPLQVGTRAIEGLIDGLGADAKHHIWHEWDEVADRLIAKNERGNLEGPIILIGHSNGVLSICNIATRLASHKIEVEYLGAIDPTAAAFAPVSRNVKLVDEFWASSGYPKFKRWLTRNKRGACQFTKGFSGEHNLYQLKAPHVGIASHHYVHDRISNQVSRITGGSNG